MDTSAKGGSGGSSTESPPAPVPAPPPAILPEAMRRAREYLAAMGVREEPEIERLSARVYARVVARAAAAPPEDPLEAAIEETYALLDRWLVDELGPPIDPEVLLGARAALLGGAVPGWTARWAGLSDRSLAPRIRALVISALPEPAPLTMKAAVIDLFFHRLGCRVARLVTRLLCRPPSGKSSAGEPR